MSQQQTVHFGVQTGPFQAEMRSGVLPPIGPEDLLLKMEICNICTEDYQRWLGLREFAIPMADGHEYVGVIVAKGKDVIEAYQIGDRVGKLNQYCGACDDCRRGNSGDCKYAVHKGVGLEEYHGMKGFADYKILNQRMAIKVSNEISAQEAAFLEPLATVIHGMKKLRVKPLENVVVIGAGTMGLLNAQVAKQYGARVILTELSPKKLERARKLGVSAVIDASNSDPVEEVKRLTNGEGADAVIFAIGSTSAYKQGYDMLKHWNGRLLFFPAGFPEPTFDFDPNTVHYRKMELIGTINADNADFIEAARMLSTKLVDVSLSLEGKIYPLRDFAGALAAAAIPDSYRVSVDVQGV